MILRSVTFTDFGVYGGTQTLELAPDVAGDYDRPIVLFRGKNGVGKTTFVEGVRLALHGPLALGPRTSRKAYEHHLRRRIHRPSGSHAGAAGSPTAASVNVVLDFVRGGERHTYDVTRAWRSTGSGLVETVSLMEDGELPRHIPADDYNAFLRELVPAVAGDLFFFDGEKIDRLVDDEAADEALGAAIEQLLGLHLVSLLDADLGVYINRSLDRADRSEAEGELADAQAFRDQLVIETQLHDVRVRDAQDTLVATAAEIQRHEQKLASEGGSYAQHYEALKAKKRQFEIEIEASRRTVVELASGVLPFALAPRILGDTLDQMAEEARYRDAQAVREIVERQRRTVRAILQDDATYEAAGASVSVDKRKKLAEAVLAAVFAPEPDIVEPDDLYIHASDHDRATFTAWRDEAAGLVRQAVRDAAADFASKVKAAKGTEEALLLAPPDIILQPIVEALGRLRTRYADQERELDGLLAEASTSHFKLGTAENRLARAHDALAAGQGASETVQLAIRTRKAFEAYAATLRARKVRAFSDVVLARFNELSRKAHLLSKVNVDPNSFAVTLYRDGQAFRRSELSAGEKQLFAVSALWALREVSEVPMPVVVDTPLGRLDQDHRLAMVRTFFPHVSHQVILLATDTEVDRALAEEIAPAVSHGYRMVFDNATGATTAERFSPGALAGGDAELLDPAQPAPADGLIELDVLPS